MKKMNYFFLVLLFSLTGCSTINGWFGWGGSKEPEKTQAQIEKEKIPKYSDNPQMSVPSNRQYRRMTRSRMEEESELHSQAGSMWVNDGQTAYLFAQNKTRREGDVLNVKLDPVAMKQVETKVSVIKKLLKQLEEQQAADAARKLAEAEAAKNGGADRAPASAPANGAAAAAPAKPEPPKEAKKEEKEDLSDIQQIPTRIVEKQADGNYRIKGAQPFMIGKREYKVIVTGMIRPEDYNDEGVVSTKLLDPQYDVVSIRRNKNSEQTGVQ